MLGLGFSGERERCALVRHVHLKSVGDDVGERRCELTIQADFSVGSSLRVFGQAAIRPEVDLGEVVNPQPHQDVVERRLSTIFVKLILVFTVRQDAHVRGPSHSLLPVSVPWSDVDALSILHPIVQ